MTSLRFKKRVRDTPFSLFTLGAVQWYSTAQWTLQKKSEVRQESSVGTVICWPRMQQMENNWKEICKLVSTSSPEGLVVYDRIQCHGKINDSCNFLCVLFSNYAIWSDPISGLAKKVEVKKVHVSVIFQMSFYEERALDAMPRHVISHHSMQALALSCVDSVGLFRSKESLQYFNLIP